MVSTGALGTSILKITLKLLLLLIRRVSVKFEEEKYILFLGIIGYIILSMYGNDKPITTQVSEVTHSILSDIHDDFTETYIK